MRFFLAVICVTLGLALTVLAFKPQTESQIEPQAEPQVKPQTEPQIKHRPNRRQTKRRVKRRAKSEIESQLEAADGYSSSDFEHKQCTTRRRTYT